jgi:uncharacterized protein YndB with AHSA1/START domain
MIDLIDELNGVRRETVDKMIPPGDGHAVILRRTYDATIADVWDAITTRERIERWFLPITGDLKRGGTYQLEGNAGGTILVCDPPQHLKITWVFGEDTTERDVSEVDVRLTAEGEDRTLLELEHAAVVDDEWWAQYGPGAVGVGWDLTLLGLAMLLDDGSTIENRDEWYASPDAREFMTRSARAWGDAMLAAGATREAAEAAVQGTTSAYVPEAEPRIERKTEPKTGEA